MLPVPWVHAEQLASQLRCASPALFYVFLRKLREERGTHCKGYVGKIKGRAARLKNYFKQRFESSRGGPAAINEKSMTRDQ